MVPEVGLLKFAVSVRLLVHVPPGVISLSVMESPTHKGTEPVIGAGNGFTVTSWVIWQPVASVYVMVALPVSFPKTIPEEEPMAAMVGLLLTHVPPGSASVSVLLVPIHTLKLPSIGDGNGFTVTVVVTKQPVAKSV